MSRRKLPIGIQTFRKIREDDAYYVDKTPWIRRLMEEGSVWFLSRPRRFGKSLLLDTIAEVFAGSEALFRGLDIHRHRDWSVRHPVVRIDFSAGIYRREQDVDSLRATLEDLLTDLEEQHDVPSRLQTISGRFARLLRTLHERTGRRVVVLVDEYDKPILDMLDTPDVARANRETLRAFYSAIKASDAHLRFVMLTGVSKFSRVSLFSGLNNLEDITLHPGYSAICGYTERDLDEVFAPELPGLEREEIREWYNGYGWRGGERVYNPFDILLLFRQREYRAHWFETGTPTFLVEHLLHHGVHALALERMTAGEELLSSFDVGAIAPEALLFQTGYLTIVGEERKAGRTLYRLGYPNREVRESLNRFWVNHLAGVPGACTRVHLELWQALADGALEALVGRIHALFSEIPYQWHVKNPMGDYEGYYASVFYSHLAALGFELTAERSTSRGRVDLAVRTGSRVYLFEFKVIAGAEPTGEALHQLRERGYADGYRAEGVPVHLVGVEFSRETRNVVAVTAETA